MPAVTKNLTVTYNSTTNSLVITGGDNNGSDITIEYNTNATINWNRSGTNFRFTSLSLSPTSPSFGTPTVADSQISVTDNDQNVSGTNQQFQYTLAYQVISTGTIQRSDPKVINKTKVSIARGAR